MGLFVFSFKARAKLKAPDVSHNSPGGSRGAGKVKESTEGAEDAEETPKCPLGNFRGSAVLSGQHNDSVHWCQDFKDLAGLGCE